MSQQTTESTYPKRGSTISGEDERLDAVADAIDSLHRRADAIMARQGRKRVDYGKRLDALRARRTGRDAASLEEVAGAQENAGGADSARSDAQGYEVIRFGNLKVLEGVGPDGGTWFVVEGRANRVIKKFTSFEQAQRYAEQNRNDAQDYGPDNTLTTPGQGRGDSAAGDEYETISAVRGKVKVKILSPPREPGGHARVEVVEGPHKGEKFYDIPPGRQDATTRTDPPTSEAQRRAMRAAAEGKSNLGIPKKVGEEFSEADPGGKLPEHRSDGSHYRSANGIVEAGDEVRITSGQYAGKFATYLESADSENGYFRIAGAGKVRIPVRNTENARGI